MNRPRSTKQPRLAGTTWAFRVPGAIATLELLARRDAELGGESDSRPTFGRNVWMGRTVVGQVLALGMGPGVPIPAGPELTYSEAVDRRNAGRARRNGEYS